MKPRVHGAVHQPAPEERRPSIPSKAGDRHIEGHVDSQQKPERKLSTASTHSTPQVPHQPPPMTHQPSTASTHSHHVADVARKHSTASVSSHHMEEPAASKTRSGSIHGDPRSSVRERHASHEDEPPTESFSSQTSYGNHKADGTDAPLKRRSDRAQTVDPRAALRGRLEPETSEPIASRKAGRHNT